MKKAKIMICFLILITLCNAQPSSALEITITDIGTFGGICSARFINNQGQVSGHGFIDGISHVFFWTEEEGIVDLTSSNSFSSYPKAMNEIGQIVGMNMDFPQQGFIWTPGKGMAEIPSLGGPGVMPYDINNLGQVVGSSLTADYETRAFLWAPGKEIVSLPFPDDGTYSRAIANAINDSGQVVGQIQGSGGINAFFWTEDGGTISLHPVGCLSSTAVAINELGQVMVRYQLDTPPYSQRAFIWSKEEGMVDIGHFGGYYSWGIDINDLGQVVGISKYENGTHALFLWSEEGGMVPVGETLLTTNVASINNLGQIAFYGRTTNEDINHAYIWTEQDGNQQLDDSGFNSYAYAINDRGQVAGYTHSGESGVTHATLWTLQTILPPDEHIDSIIDGVEILIDSGTLNQGQGNALISKLEAAKKQLDKGNTKTACNLLRAFINQVEAFIGSGKITSAEGKTLLDNANSLIDKLGCD